MTLAMMAMNGRLYLYGKTLKEFSARIGKPIGETSDGQPIRDREMYCVTDNGIFLVP
jgi:hypothetical protein